MYKNKEDVERFECRVANYECRMLLMANVE